MDQQRLGEKIKDIQVEEEIKTYYLDYAMSVNIGRSIPDARDGLKPVHRRILYSMNEIGNASDKPYKKSARIVGDVLGKYHPHGDQAVYDSLVRLAQPFSTRYPLVDGQGNFGSIDGDEAAAMRYTEVRLTAIAESMLEELDQQTVPMSKNFDNTLDEPVVLPSKLPVLLLNGASGIGVGMASNIPPHNLGEVADCLVRLLDKPEADVEELMTLLPGPDFPTSGKIVSPAGLRKYYTDGRGSIIVQGVGKAEGEGRKTSYVITEIPYLVNKANLVTDIADLVRDKKIEGISDLRDESDRTEGVRIVIELKQGVDWKIIEKQLYKHTAYQSTFGAIMLSIVDGRPVEAGLVSTLTNFIEFRRQTVIKRTEFLLRKAEERKHILEGLHTAISNIDETVKIIRNSSTTEKASEALIQRFNFSEAQVKAILDMRLARLTALEVDKIEKEIAELIIKIKDLTEILEVPERLRQVIRDEFLDMKKRFADKRRTKIEGDEHGGFSLDDLIHDDPFIVSLTRDGYLKRVKVDAWRAQGRGGKGVQSHTTTGDDVAQDIFFVTNKQDMLTFTNLGKVYRFKVHEIPETQRVAKGAPITTILPLAPTEFVTTILPVRVWDDRFLMMVTAEGTIKKCELSQFQNIRRTGIIAITLDGEDWLRKCRLVKAGDEIILVSKLGQAVRFNEGDIRSTGRSSKGVIGIRMGKADMVVAMCVEDEGGALLCVSENGYGKMTDFDTFRLIKRGGKGVRAMNINPKSGNVVACTISHPGHHLMIITTAGQTIKICTDNIPELGRYATGVRLIRLEEGQTVCAISKVTVSSDNQEEEVVIEEE